MHQNSFEIWNEQGPIYNRNCSAASHMEHTISMLDILSEPPVPLHDSAPNVFATC
jgi:hypothetical protein